MNCTWYPSPFDWDVTEHPRLFIEGFSVYFFRVFSDELNTVGKMMCPEDRLSLWTRHWAYFDFRAMYMMGGEL